MSDFKAARDLLLYRWPKDAPTLRRAVIYSLLCLIAAKILTSLVPLAYQALVDHLEGDAENMAVPVGLVLAYGGASLMATVFDELRIALFARVSGNAKDIGNHAWGSMPLSFAVMINVAMKAARSAQRSDPAKSHGFLPSAIARSFCPCRSGIGGPLSLASVFWPQGQRSAVRASSDGPIS